MVKHMLWVAVVITVIASPASAQSRGFGAGIILGEPTGISLKGWVSPHNAVDVGLAWSFRSDGYFHIHGDYLWHFTNVIAGADRVVLYAGPGGRVGFARGGGVVGVRIAGGMAYWIEGAPLDVFLELAPVMDLAPKTEASVEGGIGIRFYFQ